MAVFRIYVEKKAEFADEAASLLGEIRGFLGIRDVNGARIINRYDVEGVDVFLFQKLIEFLYFLPHMDYAIILARLALYYILRKGSACRRAARSAIKLG